MKLLMTTLCALFCLSAPTWAASPSAAANSAVEAARGYGTAIRNCDMRWALDRMYPPLMYSMADQMAGEGEDSEARRARRIMGTSADRLKSAPEDGIESAQQAKKRREAGYKKLREKYDRMGREMRASGFKVESFSVGTPTAEYVVAPPTNVINTVKRDNNVSVEDLQDGKSRTRIVILPTRLVCSAPDQHGRIVRIRRDSFIYAVRDEVREVKNGAKLNEWYFIDGNTSINQIRAFFPKLPLNIKTPPCGDQVLN